MRMLQEILLPQGQQLTLRMPKRAKILSVITKPSLVVGGVPTPFLVVTVESGDKEVVERTVAILEAGQQFSEDQFELEYLDTFQVIAGSVVKTFHVFIVEPKPKSILDFSKEELAKDPAPPYKVQTVLAGS